MLFSLFYFFPRDISAHFGAKKRARLLSMPPRKGYDALLWRHETRRRAHVGALLAGVVSTTRKVVISEETMTAMNANLDLKTGCRF